MMEEYNNYGHNFCSAEVEDINNLELLSYLKGGVLKHDLDISNPHHLQFLEQLVDIKLSKKVLRVIIASRRNEEMEELSREDLIKEIYRGLAGFHLRRIKDKETLKKSLLKATFSLTKGGAISG